MASVQHFSVPQFSVSIRGGSGCDHAAGLATIRGAGFQPARVVVRRTLKREKMAERWGQNNGRLGGHVVIFCPKFFCLLFLIQRSPGPESLGRPASAATGRDSSPGVPVSHFGFSPPLGPPKTKRPALLRVFLNRSGGYRVRTGDLQTASLSLSQLS